MSYNRKELKADTESKSIKKPKDVIYSLNGQWEYPGQVTKVPSNRITMKGVDYPVKGIDDLGNEIMMYPDNEYLFPGTSVTEYPMMKNGGWLDKYQEGGVSKGYQWNSSNQYSNEPLRSNNAISEKIIDQKKTDAYKQQLLLKAMTYDSKNPNSTVDAEEEFKQKYGTSPHAYRYATDAQYKKQYDDNIRTADSKIQYGSNDARSNINPNAAFMFPNLNDAGQKIMVDNTNDIISSVLPIPGINKMNKFGKVAKEVDDVIDINKINFNKYPSQFEAVESRANRLISQKTKPGWNEQLTPDLENKLLNAKKNHNPNADYPGQSLGANTSGRTATVVSSDANIKGIPLTDANKSRIAAHETGHYYSNSIDEGKEWIKNFNLDKLPNKENIYLKGKSRYDNHANEIRERAGQLKDYIAQKNNIPLDKDFLITQPMLDDAIKNYVKDTGLDNSMSILFGALKDKNGLLKTMNKYALSISTPIVTGTMLSQQKKEAGGEIYGGEGLTPERAKDILSAGTSYGYPLTEKQIDFFSNIANVYVNEDGEVEEIADDGYSNEDYGDFRRGGEKRLKRYTDKNIKSSINYLMERNETLFGPRGKRYYKPNQSDWLNKY